MNRTLFAADCLDVLNDGDALPDGSIDLIYLDPPFNSNSKYNLPFKGKDKTHKPVEAFVDIWKWSDQDAETLDDLNRDPRTRPPASARRSIRRSSSATEAWSAWRYPASAN